MARSLQWFWCTGASHDALVVSSRLAKSALVLAATAATLWSIVWYGVSLNEGSRSCEDADAGRFASTVSLLGALLSIPAGSWLLVTGVTHRFQLATWFATASWARSAFIALNALNGCEEGDMPNKGFISSASVAMNGLIFTLLPALILDRLAALEDSTLQTMFAQRLWPFRWVCVPLAITLTVLKMLGFEQPGILWFFFLVTFSLLSFFSLWGLYLAGRNASAAASLAQCYATPQRGTRAKQAAVALRLQIRAGVASLFSTLLYIFVMSFLRRAEEGVGYDILSALVLPVYFLDIVCNSCFALSVTGALSGAARSGAKRAGDEQRRRKRWQRSAAAVSTKGLGELPEREWHQKVLEMSGRGFTLDSLLKFYRALGTDLMPGFDPEVHRTRDVVEEAIIPATAKQGCSYASLMMSGQYTTPTKFVTHNWDNLFSGTVSAIVADALGEKDFSMVAFLLVQDLDKLEAWIAKRGVGLQTYWICAFSVNQRGALNDTLPMLPDGRSIPCEMNKFTDMMRYLAATNPDFQQVIAVDVNFRLFTRAWCVAEVATAHEVGMQQNLKVSSADNLMQHVKQLHDTKIQDMETSRVEDKQEIMDGIKDPESFNRMFQRLLFEELLPAWRALDGEELVALAGATIRWDDAISSVSPTVWATGLPADGNLGDDNQVIDNDAPSADLKDPVGGPPPVRYGTPDLAVGQGEEDPSACLRDHRS